MKELFHITDGAPIGEEAVLLCEIGEQYLCTAQYIPEKNQIHSLSYLSFPFNEIEQSVIATISQQWNTNPKKTFIAAAFPEAVLIPERLFEKTALKNYFITAPANAKLLYDSIEGWGIVTAYGFPYEIYKFFMDRGNGTIFHHAYTTELKAYNGFVSKDHISIHFIPQQIRVIVKKEGQVQLAQMYHYTSPLDVVYYLLKMMEAFQLNKEETFCVLSGLIDEDSSLYKELSNYFHNLQFARPNITLPQNEYPSHFFTSLFNLAACVSSVVH